MYVIGPKLSQNYVCNKLSKSLITTDFYAAKLSYHVWGNFECNIKDFKLLQIYSIL